jgi:hypothetical protein
VNAPSLVEIEPDDFALLEVVLADPALVATARATLQERLAALAAEVGQELTTLRALGASEPDAVAAWLAAQAPSARACTRYRAHVRLRADEEESSWPPS